jgi:glycosyltransferase involved in cell wall biosynthesis
MKVWFFAGGLDATLKARILPLARSLSAYDIDCQVVAPINWSSRIKGKLGNVLSIGLSHSPEKYFKAFSDPPDVAIIGRVSSPQIYLLQEMLQQRGVKVIFDLDDALFLSTGNFLGAKIRPGSFCLEKMLSAADYVTANGQYLSAFASLYNSKVGIVPDPVDTHIFYPTTKKVGDKLVLGWEGVGRHHYRNLSLLIEPLIRLSKEYNFKLNLVSSLGDPLIKQMFAPLEEKTEIDYGPTKWVSIEEIADFVSNFDIMLCPLEKTPWCEGKSALRVGIGMAMEIPVVASPVGEQKHVVQNGVNGYLAESSDDWYCCLSRLAENPKLRKEMGRQGRRIVDNSLSKEMAGKKLLEIIETFRIQEQV